MWTQASWTAALMVGSVLAALAAVGGVCWGIQRTVERRRARDREEAAKREGWSVYAIQARIDRANAQETARLSGETAARRQREEYAEFTAAVTDDFVAVPPALDDTAVIDAVVPHPRPPRRARPYLAAREAAGRAGTS